MLEQLGEILCSAKHFVLDDRERIFSRDKKQKGGFSGILPLPCSQGVKNYFTKEKPYCPELELLALAAPPAFGTLR
jgi:hypothetical protein